MSQHLRLISVHVTPNFRTIMSHPISRSRWRFEHNVCNRTDCPMTMNIECMPIHVPLDLLQLVGEDRNVFNCLTDCRTYVSSNWPRSRLYLNLSGTFIGTEYRKSLTKFTRCLLNFDNLSRNAVFILENQFFDEDLTVTKHEKARIFPHASWAPNDPLDGLHQGLSFGIDRRSIFHLPAEYHGHL